MYTSSLLKASSKPQSIIQMIGICLLANIILVVCSYISLPNAYIPVTFQTFGVCLVGLLLGARAGTLMVFVWLAQAWMGWPVLAEGAAGPAVFMGPTAGYLLAFPLMAMIVGMLQSKSLYRVIAPAILLAQLGCLFIGSIWLKMLMQSTLNEALMLGAYPFIAGAIIKTILLVSCVRIWQLLKTQYKS